MKHGPWYTDDPDEVRQLPVDLPEGLTLSWTDLHNGCGIIHTSEERAEFVEWHKAHDLPTRTHSWVFGEGEVRVFFQVPGEDVKYRCKASWRGKPMDWSYNGPPMAEDTFPCSPPPEFVFRLIAHFDAEHQRLRDAA